VRIPFPFFPTACHGCVFLHPPSVSTLNVESSSEHVI
jgi:hypothetical protein